MKNIFNKKTVIVKTVMAVVAVTNLTLTALFFTDKLLLSIGLILIQSALFLLSQVLTKIDSAIYKLILLANCIVFFLVVSYALLSLFGVLNRVTSAESLKNMILSAGNWGIVVYFFITVLQVVVLPIPAAVTVLLGALIYGNMVAFVVSSLGTIAGSLVCYAVGRYFGFKVVSWVAGEEKTVNAMSLLGKKGKIPFVAMLIFPFFPDDILCMTAGLVKMSFKFFIITICICRPIAIAFISFLGTGSVIPFEGWGIPVWIAIFAVILFVAYLISYGIKRKDNLH